MNNLYQHSYPALCRLACGLLLLSITGARAAPADTQPPGGIPGILKYAQQYREENTAGAESTPEGAGQTRAGNTELRRRLAVQEQTLRQLKKENRALRDRMKARPAPSPGSAEQEKQLASLKTALAESRKQQDTVTRQAEQARAALNAQILDLKQQLARNGAEGKSARTEAEKEKAALMLSLKNLKAELAGMPVVKPETLGAEVARQAYASGVMLGRDMLTLQAAQKQLGLRTDNRILVAGVWDALNQKVLLNEPDLDAALHQAESVAQKARLTVIRAQKKTGEAYLEAFRKQKGVRQAESGFWYRIEHAGDGELIKGDDTLVDVVATEKLTDGTVVEDMDARGRVISQPLSEYPPVFRSALMLLKNHGTIELVVPPALAYGNEGYPPRIPPGATMVYTLRVEEVKVPENASDSRRPGGRAGKEKGAK